MQLSKSTIIDNVRLRIDEIRKNESDFDGSIDETDIDDIIEGLALEALRFVNSNADQSLLEPDEQLVSSGEGATFSLDTTCISGKSVGVFTVAKNILRFLSANIKYTDKHKVVYGATSDTEALWDKFIDPYLSGVEEDPKVGMSHIDFSTHTTDKDKTFVLVVPMKTGDTCGISYMTDPSWTNDNKLNVSRYLTEAYIYYLAALVLSTMGDNRSQAALGMAMPLMGAKIAQPTE